MRASSVSNIASRATQLARQVGTSVTVKPGDTLSAIAKQHNISLQNLLDANPRKKANPDLIRPGEVIAIPSSPQGEAQNTATSGIPSHHLADAATHGLTSLDDLIAKFLSQLPGTGTSSPTVTATPQTVTVAKGDTLSAIAQRFDTTTDALRNANGLNPADDRFLPVGKELRLPEGAKEIANKPTAQERSVPIQNAPVPAADKKTAVSGEQIANEAKSHFGKTPEELSKSKELPAMKGGYDANCANFVSAVLVKLGLLDSAEHELKVANLRKKLENDKGWTSVTFRDNNGKINLDSLKEGDVIFMENEFSHVEFITKDETGNLVTTGSNGKSSKQIIGHHTNWDWIETKATTVLRQP